MTEIKSLSVIELGEYIDKLTMKFEQAAKTRERKEIRMAYEEAAKEYNDRIGFKAFQPTLK